MLVSGGVHVSGSVWEASAVSVPQACCHTIISTDKSGGELAAKS